MKSDIAKKRIYCSGTLFSPEERGTMRAIAHVLEEIATYCREE